MKYSIAVHEAPEDRPVVILDGATDPDATSFDELARILCREFEKRESDPTVLGLHLLVRPDRVELDGEIAFG